MIFWWRHIQLITNGWLLHFYRSLTIILNHKYALHKTKNGSTPSYHKQNVNGEYTHKSISFLFCALHSWRSSSSSISSNKVTSWKIMRIIITFFFLQVKRNTNIRESKFDINNDIFQAHFRTGYWENLWQSLCVQNIISKRTRNLTNAIATEKRNDFLHNLCSTTQQDTDLLPFGGESLSAQRS